MRIGIISETFTSERRVALVPAGVAALRSAGIDVLIESGAGSRAGFTDDAYAQRGATVLPDRQAVFAEAEVILQVRTPGANPTGGSEQVQLAHPGQALIGFAEALTAHDMTKALNERKVTLYAVELMPRITRAQSMDALSSQANLVGFKAVMLGAATLGKILPLLMTAAGTIQPAKVLVVGAGVAGLQAIATAKRLGAVVSGFDVRPAAREHVESLGAQFVDLALNNSAEDKSGYAKAQSEQQIAHQRKMMAKVVAESDMVITTAAVPGQKAPVLVTREMVEKMAPGSVIVDVSADRGGNCELTQPGKTIQHDGVTVIGNDNLPALAAFHASQMYSSNMINFIKHLNAEGRLRTDRSDEIVSGTLVCHGGEIVNERVRERMGLPPPQPPTAAS